MIDSAFGEGEHIGDFLDKNRFKKRPRYTMILHEVRGKFGLSTNTYVVIDSIHKLSSTSPRYPYCTMSKEALARFLDLSRATVFRAITEGEKKSLLERSPHQSKHLRTTEKWINGVELYDIKAQRSRK